jgi:DUF1680 family protein
LESMVRFEVQASKVANFAIRLRIPAWAVGASVTVNGHRWDTAAVPGTFATIRRTWKSGDRVEVDLPLTMRLEAIDAQPSHDVALLTGPLVLFAITETQPALKRADLLAAKKTGSKEWRVATGTGSMNLLPFTAIEDEPYSTYLRVS